MYVCRMSPLSYIYFRRLSYGIYYLLKLSLAVIVEILEKLLTEAVTQSFRLECEHMETYIFICFLPVICCSQKFWNSIVSYSFVKKLCPVYLDYEYISDLCFDMYSCIYILMNWNNFSAFSLAFLCTWPIFLVYKYLWINFIQKLFVCYASYAIWLDPCRSFLYEKRNKFLDYYLFVSNSSKTKRLNKKY